MDKRLDEAAKILASIDRYIDRIKRLRLDEPERKYCADYIRGCVESALERGISFENA